MFPLKDDNPTDTTPIVTIGLIALCVCIFFYQFSLTDTQNYDIVIRYGMIPKNLLNNPNLNEFFTILSSMFFHGKGLHINYGI